MTLSTNQPLPDLLIHDERELDVLAEVHRASDTTTVSQRSIANALGMSVGLTNAILKRLTDKGYLMMRRINAHNVHYLVSPAGIDQITLRSYRYLRRTIGHVVRYKERLRTWCADRARSGISTIQLVGTSDLAFILEWCALKEGLAFRHIDTAPPTASSRQPDTLVVWSETYLTPPVADAILLHDIVVD